ncbi:MAG: hypothetical protein ABFD89_00985 [Bryobacteraceae bacterium]
MRPLSLDKRGRLKIDENHVQRACVELLEAEGYRVFVTHERDARKSSGRKGQNDLVAVRRDGTLLIECKRPGKKQSPEQIAYGRKAIADGLNYIVVHDVDELRAELGAWDGQD